MKVLGPKENFRVVINPRRLGDLGMVSVSDSFLHGDDQARISKEYEDRCSSILEDVRRHVDNAGHSRVEFDRDSVCSFCGRVWTEESKDYNGGCCDADEKNNPDNLKGTTL